MQPWERPLALHGQIVLAIMQYTLLHCVCTVCWGYKGKEGNRTRDCHSAVHGVDRSATRPAVQWGGL